MLVISSAVVRECTLIAKCTGLISCTVFSSVKMMVSRLFGDATFEGGRLGYIKWLDLTAILTSCSSDFPSLQIFGPLPLRTSYKPEHPSTFARLLNTRSLFLSASAGHSIHYRLNHYDHEGCCCSSVCGRPCCCCAAGHHCLGYVNGICPTNPACSISAMWSRQLPRYAHHQFCGPAPCVVIFRD